MAPTSSRLKVWLDLLQLARLLEWREGFQFLARIAQKHLNLYSWTRSVCFIWLSTIVIAQGIMAHSLVLHQRKKSGSLARIMMQCSFGFMQDVVFKIMWQEEESIATSLATERLNVKIRKRYWVWEWVCRRTWIRRLSWWFSAIRSWQRCLSMSQSESVALGLPRARRFWNQISTCLGCTPSSLARSSFW
jgi:hypothetical protein